MPIDPLSGHSRALLPFESRGPYINSLTKSKLALLDYALQFQKGKNAVVLFQYWAYFPISTMGSFVMSFSPWLNY